MFLHVGDFLTESSQVKSIYKVLFVTKCITDGGEMTETKKWQEKEQVHHKEDDGTKGEGGLLRVAHGDISKQHLCRNMSVCV